MAVYVRPFKASDLSAFTPIEPMAADGLADVELAKAIEKSELAITGIRNGQIVGCGGVHPINGEQGELWLRLSEECLKYRFDTLRWLKSGMKIIEETFPFERLHATMQGCYAKGIKLVEYLGFKKGKRIEFEGQEWFVYSKEIKCQQHS